MSQKRICRVAGVAIKDNHVLIHRFKEKDYWTFPGGGCKFYETTTDALEREFLSETGGKITINRLLFIVENLYLKKNIPNHEIEFFYEIELEDSFSPEEEYFYGKEGEEDLIFYWCPLDKLEEMRIYPKCLKKALLEIPENIVHVIHKSSLEKEDIQKTF